VNLRDLGEPGVNDEIAITLFNSGGTLLFSSNWAVTSTANLKLSGGNIYINSSSFVGGTARIESTQPLRANLQPGTFDVKVMGNPTTDRFTIRMTGGDLNTKITLRVTDINGRLIEVRENLYSGQLFQFGNNYAQGVYFAEVTQGDERRVIRLVKSN